MIVQLVCFCRPAPRKATRRIAPAAGRPTPDSSRRGWESGSGLRHSVFLVTPSYGRIVHRLAPTDPAASANVAELRPKPMVEGWYKIVDRGECARVLN
eukprot:267698-Pyramimonas_sp.AAC.2